MRFLTCLLLMIGLLLFPTGQAAEPMQTDTQIWTPVFLELPVNEKVYGYLEINPRFGNGAHDLNQLLVLPAVGVRLNEHWSGMVGYCWTESFDSVRDKRWEHMTWQQLATKYSFKGWKISNRARLEERWIEGLNETSLRGRLALRGTHPLGKGDWYMVGMNEVFLNLNTVAAGPQKGFQQDHLFLGIGRQFGKHVRAEAGYQIQFISRKAPAPDELDHILVMNLFVHR